MDKEISHALSSRIKKSTRTAFWYQLNDLIHKIHEYKTRFEDENNCKDNRGKNKRPKKVSKRSNTNNKSIVEKKIDCETIYNETESKQANKSDREEEYFATKSHLKSMKNIHVKTNQKVPESSILMITPRPKDYQKLTIFRK